MFLLFFKPFYFGRFWFLCGFVPFMSNVQWIYACTIIIMHHQWFRALSSASDIHTQIKLLLSKDKWSNIMIFSSPRNENEGNNMRICDVHHGQFWRMAYTLYILFRIQLQKTMKPSINLTSANLAQKLFSSFA